jgi:hypothetical protein
LLSAQKNSLFALGQLCQDAFGQGATGPFFTGLACVPNTPAAMNVIVQPGAVYAQAALDATAYSSLAADSTVTMKQGILKTAQTFATPAPTTSGQSVVYLISASFLEADTNAVVLPYYNASNPSQAYSGPSGTGASQNTLRQDTVQLTLTAGVPATTGTQQTPATPAGQTALYTITVAYGATSVTAANIASVNSRFTGFVRPDGSTPFTAAQPGVTPAQFDTSTKLATMAALIRDRFGFSGFTYYNAQATLPASAMGSIIDCGIGSGAYTLWLPTPTAAMANSAIKFVSYSSSPVTVNTGSSAKIWLGVNGASSGSAITLQNGDTATLITDGSAWYVVDGTVLLAATALFGASLAASGYQKLPSGLIVQWGTVTVTGTALTTQNFPIAFPNAFVGGFVSPNDNGTAVTYRGSVNGGVKTGMNVYMAGTSTSIQFYWQAIGY